MMMVITLPGVLDAILHILFAVVGMLLIHRVASDIPWVFIIAIVMELVIDGAHLVNKAITHNIFFLIQMPFLMLFSGYVLSSNRLQRLSLLILVNNFTHLIMDLFYEGDSLPLYFPVNSLTVSVPPYDAGFATGMGIWMAVVAVLALFLKLLENRGPKVLFPPLVPT